MRRWYDHQVTVGADGKPLAPGSRALCADEDSAASPSKKRKGENGGPSREGEVNMKGLRERGGASAESSYAKGAEKANWAATLDRVHGVGQCAECEAASIRVVGGRCEAHGPPSSVRAADANPVWWHKPQADSGAAMRYAEAKKREEGMVKVSDSGWRCEWHGVRGEQLKAQGEPHGASNCLLYTSPSPRDS